MFAVRKVYSNTQTPNIGHDTDCVLVSGNIFTDSRLNRIAALHEVQSVRSNPAWAALRIKPVWTVEVECLTSFCYADPSPLSQYPVWSGPAGQRSPGHRRASRLESWKGEHNNSGYSFPAIHHIYDSKHEQSKYTRRPPGGLFRRPTPAGLMKSDMLLHSPQLPIKLPKPLNSPPAPAVSAPPQHPPAASAIL